MRVSKTFFFIAAALLAASCGTKPKTYTFKGEVIFMNKCSLNADELPERIKVSYVLHGKEKNLAAEQVIETHKLDDTSVKGEFSMTVSTDINPSDYTAIVTRPNGKNICDQLPCPNGLGCKGNNKKENIALGDRTSVTDTLNLSCGCSF